MQMSVSNYDLLQAKVDAELARYTRRFASALMGAFRK